MTNLFVPPLCQCPAVKACLYNAMGWTFPEVDSTDCKIPHIYGKWRL